MLMTQHLMLIKSSIKGILTAYISLSFCSLSYSHLVPLLSNNNSLCLFTLQVSDSHKFLHKLFSTLVEAHLPTFSASHSLTGFVLDIPPPHIAVTLKISAHTSLLDEICAGYDINPWCKELPLISQNMPSI